MGNVMTYFKEHTLMKGPLVHPLREEESSLRGQLAC